MSSSPMATSKYVRVERGQLNTLSYRAFLKNSETNEIVSPFHDIPLFADKDNAIFNAVIEIPRWSNAKMEINKKEKFNPITQDVKNSKLRFVNNVNNYHGYIWNYGALPQTWEDPNEADETTTCNGDNDPLDVCEIGSRIQERGSVVRIKVLGALGLIDEGEADWKIICIDVNDPMAEKLNDINDVSTHLPGLLEATRDWFRIYKIPTGKPANNFAADGKFFDREFALKTIQHDHKSWSNLIHGGYDAEPDKKKGISLVNTTLSDTGALRVNSDEATKTINESTPVHVAQPAFIDCLPIDTVHFVKL